MNVDQVRHFVAVARAGSVTAAARGQHLSQPALSRSVRHLEEELGATLFDRGRNALALSRVGRELLPYAEELLAAERRMRQACLDASRRERVLRVGTVAPAPLWYLTALIVERMPGALVSTEMVDDELDVERALFGGLIDLAICTRAVPGMRAVLLMRESLYLSAPADHPLARRTSVSFADLDGETFLLYGGIGFWRDMHRRMTPHAHMVVQQDREVWQQLMRTTRMLGFASDAPVLMRPPVAGGAAGDGAEAIAGDGSAAAAAGGAAGDGSAAAGGVGSGADAAVERALVPISDPEAHASFYLCARERDGGDDGRLAGGVGDTPAGRLVRAVMELVEQAVDRRDAADRHAASR